MTASASSEAPVKPVSPVAAVNGRWTTAQLIAVIFLTSVISIAGYMACVKLRRFSRSSPHSRGTNLRSDTPEL